MIDAHAVVAHLETLGQLTSAGNTTDELAWLRQNLEALPLQHTEDAAGNHWFTLPGTTDRAVVLGSHLELPSGNDPAGSLDSRLGVVVGLETLKALAHRCDNQPSCTLKLVVWAGPASAPTHQKTPALASVLAGQSLHAYLELHTEPTARLEHAGTPLGVVNLSSVSGPTIFHPHLMALCDEAIRELTGNSAAIPAGPAPHAMEMAHLGIPTAMMYVQALTGPPEAARLHLLQAAEAFGRWAESTMHLVAGDKLDLWAREGRVPHA